MGRDDGLEHVREILNAHHPPLSAMAKRVLLLTAQVPVGQWTTFTRIKVYYDEHWGMLPKTHISSALNKCEVDWLQWVPVWRVIANASMMGTGFESGLHHEVLFGHGGWEASRRVLEEEGVRFASDGGLVGGRLGGLCEVIVGEVRIWCFGGISVSSSFCDDGKWVL